MAAGAKWPQQPSVYQSRAMCAGIPCTSSAAVPAMSPWFSWAGSSREAVALVPTVREGRASHWGIWLVPQVQGDRSCLPEFWAASSSGWSAGTGCPGRWAAFTRMYQQAVGFCKLLSLCCGKWSVLLCSKQFAEDKPGACSQCCSPTRKTRLTLGLSSIPSPVLRACHSSFSAGAMVKKKKKKSLCYFITLCAPPVPEPDPTALLRLG